MNGTFMLTGELTDDIMSGMAEWSAVSEGVCDPSLDVDTGEVIEFSGTRVSTDPGLCEPHNSSLTQKFVRHPELILIDGD